MVIVGAGQNPIRIPPDRMAHVVVGAAGHEGRRGGRPAAEREPHAAQAKQVEVVDHEGRHQEQQPARTAQRPDHGRTVVPSLARDGARLRYAGLVLCRQRPATASGVTFMTLEDETGFVNVVLWQPVFERYPVLARTAALLGVTGKVQSEEGVVHLIADRLWQPHLPRRPDAPRSRDFR